MAQKIKNATARQEAQEMPVPSLGPEGLLEKGMAAHSSILAWGIPWTEESGGLQWGHKEQNMTERLSLSLSHSCKQGQKTTRTCL